MVAMQILQLNKFPLHWRYAGVNPI